MAAPGKISSIYIYILSVCVMASCGQNDVPVIKMGKDINRTDTLGIESIALRIDTITLRTDSLYDITLFGVSEDRMFGLTAEKVLVIMDRDGQVLKTSRRTGRGPGEFTNLGRAEYDPYNEEILLLDYWNKIIRLDTDGNLIEEIKNGNTSSIGDIRPLSKDRYAATGMSDYSREYCITIMDREINPVNRMLPLQNNAQKSNKGIIALEYMKVFNSKVLYKPFGEFTYYELSDSIYSPYLTVDCGRYTLPPEMNVRVGDHADKQNNFQIDEEFICGKYYFAQYLHEKGMCWYYDIFDISTGKRVSHFRYGMEEYKADTDEGFILRCGDQRYGIIPQFVKDNVLYWSRFNDDGTTTLFMISL